MVSPLDMALDEVITTSGGDKKPKGKGKKKGAASQRDVGQSAKKTSDLDGSLDDLIENGKGRGKSRFNGKGKKSSGKGKGDDGKGNDSWSSASKGSSWRSSKGDSKGEKGEPWRPSGAWKGKDRWSKGGGSDWDDDRKGSKGNWAPSWNQHDDRDEQDDWGKGKGPSKWRNDWHEDDRGGGRGYAAPARRSGGGAEDRLRSTEAGDRGWQRIEQEPEAPPRRPMRRESPREPRGRTRKPPSDDSPPRGAKRRAESPPRKVARRDDRAEPPRKVSTRDDRHEPPRKTAKATSARDKPRSKNIIVTNIPKDLGARDIRDAFEAEAGPTTRCDLERGTAYISFRKVEDAQKAVETFDRGELNGKIISVAFE